jgi:hypothetical protein
VVPGSVGSLGYALDGGSKEEAVTAAKWGLTGARFGTVLAAKRLPGVVGAGAVKAFGKANLYVTGLATAYDLTRRFVC